MIRFLLEYVLDSLNISEDKKHLLKTFGTEDPAVIWSKLNDYLDVYKITTSQVTAIYNYHWSDADFRDRQIQCITQG